MIGTVVALLVFDLDVRPGVLFSLALFTPSTGFILDSIPSLGLTDHEAFWVKSKAIASELLALGILFVTVQSSEATTLGFSALILVAMIVMAASAVVGQAHAMVGAQLVVVGNRASETPVVRLMLGSVALEIASTAHCSVLVTQLAPRGGEEQ